MNQHIPLSPMLFLATAQAFPGIPDPRNALGVGPLSDACLREVGVRERRRASLPWSAAFVHHVGFWSHYDESAQLSSWPMPATCSPEKLHRWGRKHHLFVQEPRAGDVFLFWAKGEKRFVRAGIITSVTDEEFLPNQTAAYICRTVEGDTDRHLSHRGGGRVLRHERLLGNELGDRFIRWADYSGDHALPTPVEGPIKLLPSNPIPFLRAA